MQKIVGVTKCFTFTPANVDDTAAYSAGDLFCRMQEVTGITINEDGCTWLQKVVIKDRDANDASFLFYICAVDPNVDNVPNEPLVVNGGFTSVSAYHLVETTDWVGFGSTSISQTFGTASNPIKAVDGKLYVVIVMASAATFSAPENVEIELYFTPDSSLL